MAKDNIVLIGMMGTGKSVTAKVLSEMLSMYVLDIDELLEYEYGNIDEIFSLFGEEVFRRYERELVKRISSYNNTVISTGGGVPLDERNMLYLSENAEIVWLTCNSAEILRREKKAKKKLVSKMKTADVEKMQKERAPFYQKYAEIIVQTDGLTAEQTATKIVEALLNKYGVSK